LSKRKKEWCLSMRSESYDLHCHSTCSDGTLTPKQLIDLAKKRDLKGLAITDHDTVAAYTPEVFEYAKEQGIELITGLECSTEHQKREGVESVHILGLGVDPNHPKLVAFCDSHRDRRRNRLSKIVEMLKSDGFDIDEGFLTDSKEGTIGRPHIAKQLIDKGYVKDMNDAFKKFLGSRAPYFVKTELPSIEETIATIKISGGRAILAHPILIKGKKTFKKIVSTYGFDGLECFYGNFSRDKEEPYVQLCKEKNLLRSGGSDFHGENRTFVKLGESYTMPEDFERLNLDRYGI
jgi:3',5'-nucleoside bisphosphate phosphatase